jgi:hypothetical protein
MSTGWLTWACLLLAAGVPGNADEIVHINQRGFQIPIKVLPGRQHEVRELYLHLSRDQGRTWELYARSKPDKKGFDFFTDRDGLLYFSIQVVDQKGVMDPPDVYRAPVGQKILIDTVKPVVKLVSADRLGDEIQVGWEVREDRPEWTSLRLEYRVGESPSGQWTPLPINPGARGNYRFKPGLPGPVTLRLALRDLAGNEGVDERLVTGSGSFDRSVVSAGAITPVAGAAPPPDATPGSPPPPETASPSAALATAAPLPSPSPPAAAPVAPSGGMPTRGPLPALQIVNKRQVQLGFNVSRFGPSGLGSVDVYVTTDEGASWEKAPTDPNVTLPVTGENRGQGAVRGSVTVSLPSDGKIYGFYLVVKSRAGLGKAPPRPGDTPQVRIEVDTLQPEAELYAPQPEPTRSDALVLSWKATDRNLAANPVSLEWAASASGPWTFIGEAQMPNSGRYTWTVPDNTPPKVYLKLTVRDTAGNTAVAQTPQPVTIDLFKPEVGEVNVMVGTGR